MMILAQVTSVLSSASFRIVITMRPSTTTTTNDVAKDRKIAYHVLTIGKLWLAWSIMALQMLNKPSNKPDSSHSKKCEIADWIISVILTPSFVYLGMSVTVPVSLLASVLIGVSLYLSDCFLILNSRVSVLPETLFLPMNLICSLPLFSINL